MEGRLRLLCRSSPGDLAHGKAFGRRGSGGNLTTPRPGDPRFSDLCRGLPVEIEEMDPEHATEADLLPAEQAQVSRAVTKRVREFAAGRLCARKAMSRLGVNAGPLLNDMDRCPVWPNGVCGSITHTRGLCAAIVGWKRSLAGIGVDAERIAPVEKSVIRSICTPEERSWLAVDRMRSNLPHSSSVRKSAGTSVSTRSAGQCSISRRCRST